MNRQAELKEWSGSVFDFRVLMDDNTVVEVRNTLGDLVRWERNREERWGSKPVGVEGLMYLAWLAGRRRTPALIDEAVFDRWAEHVLDIDADSVKRSPSGGEAVEDGGLGLTDPSQPDHSATDSQSSQ